MMRRRCCCGTGRKIRITEHHRICGVARHARWYAGPFDATSPIGSCGQLPSVLTADLTACGCGCSRSVSDFPSSNCEDGSGGMAKYNLQPFDITVREDHVDSRTVEFDYLDQAAVTGTGNWRWHDGSSLIVTNFTFSWTQVRQRYRNVSLKSRNLEATGTSPLFCCQCVDAATGAEQDVYFAERGTYLNDIDAFGVYGASSQYATWTIEITAGLAIVRDGSGTLMYQWSLSAHTMDSLRAAIDATAELVGRRIALSAGTNLRNAAATSIPQQGPKQIGQAISSEAKIKLRSAGEELEDFQIVGRAYYKYGSNFTLDGVREQEFTGSISQFRSGFALDLSQSVYPSSGQGSVSYLFSWSPSQQAPPCPSASGDQSCLGSGCSNLSFGNTSGGFYTASVPLSGTASEQVFSWENVYPSAAVATGLGCSRYACTFVSEYSAYLVEHMFEVERL